MNKFLRLIWEITKITVIALLIVVPIRVFVFQPFFVKGASMEPNFHDLDYLIIDEISYRFSEPDRGDVIVFFNPMNKNQRFIKRIIGLPGETVKVEQGNVYVNNLLLNEIGYIPFGVETPGHVTVALEEDQYFVMGDNRTSSYDSRNFGALEEERIIGKNAFTLIRMGVFAKQ